ncbi:MAG: hypothetical protein M3220_04500 [Chloroflexota bacterium]|nr:hypothetical protein [Chloroflexota bacterium]
MSRALRLLRLALRRPLGRWLFLLLLPLLAWSVWEVLGRLRVALWPEAIVPFHTSLILSAPLLAGVSAWVAARERQQGTEELFRTTP